MTCRTTFLLFEFPLRFPERYFDRETNGLFPALLGYYYYEMERLKRRLRKLESGVKVDETEHLLRVGS